MRVYATSATPTGDVVPGEWTAQYTEVMDKLKTFNPIMLKNLSTKVLPDVTTNMDTAKLYFLSLRAPLWLRFERSPMQVPAEGTYYGESTPSGDALIVDFDSNYETIKNSVFASE